MENLSYGVGVERTPAIIPAFRLTRFYKLSGAENKGKHNIYVNVWDAYGKRLTDSSLRIKSIAHTTQFYPLDKPNSPMEQGHGNVPMWANDTYSIVIVDGAGHESDKVIGLHTRHPDEGDGNTYGHHSFLLEFTLQGRDTQPPPTETTTMAAIRNYALKIVELTGGLP